MIRWMTVLATLFVLVGCNPSSNKDNENVTVSGQVMTPDGQTPLPYATVYIEDNSALVRNAQTNLCEKPKQGNFNYVCADAQGHFSLPLNINEDSNLESNPNELKVYFEKGTFAFSQSINLQDKSEISLGSIAMPSEKANIVVVEGWFDKMEWVLANSGFGEWNEAGTALDRSSLDFDLLLSASHQPGDMDDFGDLFDIDAETGQAKIYRYDLVLINCVVDEFVYNLEDEANAHIPEILREYILTGGHVVFTDLSYNFLEQALPEYIDFYGADETVYSEPETLWDASAGVELTEAVTGKVEDAQLASFLQGIKCGESNAPCIDENNQVELHGFMANWAMINEVHPENADQVKVLVTAQVPDPEDENSFTERPMTVLIKAGEGVVLFSSYHVEDDFSKDYWKAQERIIQYLLLQ